MPNSNAETRTAVLARMVKNAPGQKLGRTQVMKLFYFLQELKGVSLGYDFRLFTYGPFDSAVLGDLGTACGVEAVNEQTVIYGRGYGYDITPGRHAAERCEQLERADPRLTAQVDEVVREFGSLGAAELELRSTILFIDRELIQAQAKATGDELAARVHTVKPHFTKAMILDRIMQMEAQGSLRSLTGDTPSPIPF